MNKNIMNKSLIALMTLLTVAGCGGSTSSSSSTNSSSNVNANSSNNVSSLSTSSVVSSVISTSSSSEVLTETEMLNRMLNKLRKGVKFVGEINQTSYYLDGDHGNQTGEVVSNTYNAEFTFQSQIENAYASYVTSTAEDGGVDVFFDKKVFQGEDGYAYYYDLNYDNTIAKFPFTDAGEKVNFGYYCLNPFSFVTADDFIKVEDKINTYTFTRDKASFFAANVFGDIDYAFYDVVKSLEFIVEDGNLKSFTLIPADAYDMTINYETWEYIYYFLEQTATFEISDVATAMVEKPVVREVSGFEEERSALEAAFAKFKDKNYTANLKITNSESTGGSISYATYYYTGEHLYYSQQEDQTHPNAETDILLYDNGEEFLVPYGYSDEDSEEQVVFTKEAASSFKGYSKYTYDDVSPVISGVNGDLFDYNKTFKNYNICDEMVDDFAKLAIVPQINPVSYYIDGYCNSFKVKLTNSGDLDYITFSFDYNDGYFVESATVRLTFTNVGTTILPHNLTIAR